MIINNKAFLAACSVAMAGVFAFTGSGVSMAAGEQTASAGANMALAAAVASADAKAAAEDNENGEAAVKSALEEAQESEQAQSEADAAAQAAAEQAEAEAKAKAEEEAQQQAIAQIEAEESAALTKARLEQTIQEQEAAAEEQKPETKESSDESEEIEGTEVEGINWNGSKASEVVNYATKFVGNPYVWGGTSLTHGTDCSGFTMSVYKKFGKSIPHSSAAQRSVGKAVSIKDMKPGDLVCYSGHVALYCGNNTIVHASNPKTGIKYGNVFYRQIVAVRRLMY